MYFGNTVVLPVSQPPSLYSFKRLGISTSTYTFSTMMSFPFILRNMWLYGRKQRYRLFLISSNIAMVSKGVHESKLSLRSSDPQAKQFIEQSVERFLNETLQADFYGICKVQSYL
jgi:hypothetical protein